MGAAKTRAFDDRLPTDVEIESANQLRQILASQINPTGPTRFKLAVEKGTQAEVVLAPRIAEAFLQLLRYVGSGRAVTLVPMEEMLTTQQAGDMLNVSRPYLIKLLNDHKIPYTKIGRHRRIRAEDLFTYRSKRDAERQKVLQEIAEADAEFI